MGMYLTQKSNTLYAVLQLDINSGAPHHVVLFIRHGAPLKLCIIIPFLTAVAGCLLYLTMPMSLYFDHLDKSAIKTLAHQN